MLNLPNTVKLTATDDRSRRLVHIGSGGEPVAIYLRSVSSHRDSRDSQN